MPTNVAPPAAPPPEGVTLAQFTGLKNTVTRERLQPTELEQAKNVDVDDVGQLHRRRGYTQKATGRWHSVWTSTRGMYGVKDFMLGRVYPNYSFKALQFAGDDPVSYVQIGDDIYFSSRSVSGIIHADDSIEPWGAPNDTGTWLSPVINPVPNQLTQIRGRLIAAPPMATDLEYFNGRIYLAAGNVLWATELYNYRYVDKTKTFVQFEDEITVMGAVTDGIYVGTTTSVYFLSGTFPLNRIPVVQYGAQAGSMVKVPSELMIPDQKRPATISKNAVLFMTTSGVMVGFDNGICNAITQDTVLFPPAEKVAALFRRQDGVNSYVAVSDSGGSPTSGARIGDYIDAEIRRFTGA